MNAISITFKKVLQEGLKAAKSIPATEPYNKAMAYGVLAQAIAATGLVEDGAAAEVESEDATKEDAKKVEVKKGASNAKKDALKPEAGKGKTTPAPTEEKEEIAPVEDPAVEAETEIEEDWTEAMTELKAAELERLQAYVESWTEEYVYGDCVSAFFESSEVTGADNIRPTNIDGFLTYLDQLADSFATQE